MLYSFNIHKLVYIIRQHVYVPLNTSLNSPGGAFLMKPDTMRTYNNKQIIGGTVYIFTHSG